MSKNNYQKRHEELLKDQSLERATFAGGCFWCMEGPFEAEDAVADVFAGFAGGDVKDPSYDEAVAGETGHREAAQIFYDPKRISFKELLKIYFLQIDPTDEGGQFADRGFSYTTAIFYHSEAQKEEAQKYIKFLEDSKKYHKKIATKILPFKNFYLAEESHQDFYKYSKERYEAYKKGSGRADFVEKNKMLFEN